MSKEYLTKGTMKGRWRGYPETRKVVERMIEEGWSITVNAKGHGLARCPHGVPGPPARGVVINGSPQNDSSHANRLLNRLAQCPDRHENMR